MSQACIAMVASGKPCRYAASQEVRTRPVCGVHGNMARAWLARGDLPSWWLTSEDYGEQLKWDEHYDPTATGKITIGVS